MDSNKDSNRPSWLARQAIGTAIITGMGAIGGTGYVLYKGGSLPTGIKIGTISGLIGSIGFGGMMYDAVFGEKPSFQEKVEAERSNASRAPSHRR